MALQPTSALGRFIVEVSRPHTIRHPYPIGLPCTSDQLIAEAFTYTTHNKHERRTCVLLAGFEPAVPGIKRPRTQALDYTATGIFFFNKILYIFGVVLSFYINFN